MIGEFLVLVVFFARHDLMLQRIQKQLGDMEGEVKEIQMELAAIRKDRLDLYNLKQSTGIVVSEPEELMKVEHSNASPDGHYKKYPEETKKHSDEEMTVLKTQVRDMREETEELKLTLVEKSEQLQEYRVKLVVAVNNMNQEKVEKTKLIDENKLLKAALEDKGKEIEEMSNNLEEYKVKSMRNEEKLSQQEMRFKEKASECAQLLKDLEELRVENSRSLSRSKERADCMRKYLQTQISELERQLIQSRAHCRACQKERDEIRQRMQIQINNLQENFELAEIRFRALQNQVTSLKNSYTVILADSEDITEMNKIVST